MASAATQASLKSLSPQPIVLGQKKLQWETRLPTKTSPMAERAEIKRLYREKRFLILLLAPLPLWTYLYSINGTGYVYTLEFFLTFALLYPITEEVFFRGVIQPLLGNKLPANNRTISTANIITSLLFSAAHLINHSPLWALATFIPSLIYGYTMERYKTLYGPIILHCFYNAGYFAVAGQM
jgi:hypothetical protein